MKLISVVILFITIQKAPIERRANFSYNIYMADMDAEYRLILNNEFEIRKTKNSRYSLRGFAKLLGCDPSYLSKLNSGQIILSVDLADKFSKVLKLSLEQRKVFILSAAEEQKCHALYLIDPTLTDCKPENKDVNLSPAPRISKNK